MASKARLLNKAAILATLLTLLFFSVALAGDTVTLLGYQIDFVSVTKTGDESTWTYAVTANGDEAHGLSHWVLEICVDYSVVDPPNSPPGYTTPTDAAFGCGTTYTCQSTTYNEVEHVVADPTTGVTGIKFGDPDQQLSSSNQVTHIFQITVSKTGTHRKGDIEVGVKTNTGTKGNITGPTCDPTFIKLLSYSARSHAANRATQMAVPLTLLALVGAIGVGGALMRRGRQL